MSLRQNLKNKCHVSNLGDNERPTVDSGNIKRDDSFINYNNPKYYLWTNVSL